MLVARGSAGCPRSPTGSVPGFRSAPGESPGRRLRLVVPLTASADTVFRAEHLAIGAVVLDATQPRNTSPELIRQRPDVRLLDGGLVDVPGFRLHGGSMGLPMAAPSPAGETYAAVDQRSSRSLHSRPADPRPDR